MPEKIQKYRFNEMQIEILRQMTGVKDKKVWQKVDELMSRKEIHYDIANSIRQNDLDWTFIFPEWEDIERISKGFYSPFQLLFYEKFIETRELVKYEAPFLFTTLSRTISIFHEKPESKKKSIRKIKELRDTNRKLLQSIFWIRETTEEREAPSLEIYLPFDELEESMPNIPIGLLANVFGRGIAVTSGKNLIKGLAGRGYVKLFYSKHNGAPLAQLYDLKEDPCSNLKEFISLILKRDRHITIAQQSNPIFEFYDGGWHIVDYRSWSDTIGQIAYKKFGKTINSNVIDRITRLAYHMATHWHGGILAIVDEITFDKTYVEQQSSNSNGHLICQSLKNGRYEEGEVIGENVLMSEGIGRALMNAALQDGATIFNIDGKLLMTSAMVREQGGKIEEGGARHRAAKRLGNMGVVLAISHDGGIRLFSNNEEWNVDGIRIH